MKRTLFYTLALTLPTWFIFADGGDRLTPNLQVRYDQFTELTLKLQPIRQERLVTTEQFLEMAKDENTIILDTRSRWAFDQIHIKGAVHLNFSDFTEKKLRELIPDPNTRILIYCNNNFLADAPVVDVSALTAKSPPLALNIPTFINLWGYGYTNIFELADLMPLSDAGVPLAGERATDLASIK